MIREGRLALRRLAKRPGTNGVVVITLAVCLGVAAALFSVIESVLLDPWPYRGFDRIVVFRGYQPALGGAERRQWSVAEFKDVSEQRQVFDQVIAGRGRPVNLTGGDRPERVRAAQMSADVFPMLGVEPKLGRAFTPREDRPGAERVVVMSHGLWERRYGAAPDIVGRTLGIEGTDYTVVGVMPDRFRWWNADLWFPLRLDTAADNRTDRNLTIQARVREGVSLERAEADLNALARRWQAVHGSAIPEYRDFSFRLDYLTRGVLGDVRPALYALLGFVGLVCLIGCVNVANLLMAQAVERRREVAIHRAMGCGRRRLLGRFLLESLSLALLAGALGLLLAYWVMKLIVGLIPPVYIPAETDIDLDRWTMIFAFVSSTVAAMVFGLMPALHAAGVSKTELVREGGIRTTGGKKAGRMRSTLVVAQVTLATVLLIASGLMVRTMVELVGVDRDSIQTTSWRSAWIFRRSDTGTRGRSFASMTGFRTGSARCPQWNRWAGAPHCRCGAVRPRAASRSRDAAPPTWGRYPLPGRGRFRPATSMCLRFRCGAGAASAGRTARIRGPWPS